MIAPQRGPRSTVSLPMHGLRSHRSRVRSGLVAYRRGPAGTPWEIFLDDRRALRLKWGLLALLLLVAALFNAPL